MLQLLLVAAFISSFAWYIWKSYSPYFSFPNIFFFNWRMFRTILRGSRKGPKNKSLNTRVFKMLLAYVKQDFSKGAFVLWFLRPVLVIYGPEAIQFFANHKSVFDKPWMYKYFAFTEERGVFESNGKRAKRLRKVSAPPFYPRMMKHYIKTMNDHGMDFVHELRNLENQTSKDIGKLIKIRTMKIICEAAFGIKSNSDSEYSRIIFFIQSSSRAMDMMNYRLYRPWLHFDFMLYLSSVGRKYMKDRKRMHLIANQIIKETKDRYEKRSQCKDSNKDDTLFDKVSGKSFGDILFEEHLKDPSFTLKDIEVAVVTLIIAGFDTSSYCLMWALWLLGSHPDVQERAYEEVKSVCSEVIDCDEVAKLTYVECIIKETLRIYPVGPLFARLCNKDLYFKNHKIPSGTTIAFCPFLLHRNPNLFPEPEVFNPDRFLENSSQPWSYIPFAESVRSCIGKNFALLELKVLLAHILRNFKIISLTQKEDVEECWEVMLKSSVPLSVKFIPR